MADIEMNIIADIRTDFASKFGVPRQSGLVEDLEARVIFRPAYRNIDALRGIEGFSHLWLVWQFSKAVRNGWSPTVRPPRLGGNTRLGVFATRSPFRPNNIGLSSVKLLSVEWDTPDGPVLVVGGADLMDGTPILDVKPYIPYADCHPDAIGGFADEHVFDKLTVVIPDELRASIPAGKEAALTGVLSLDPRPSYQNDSERIYGFQFAGAEVRFSVSDGILTVREIINT